MEVTYKVQSDVSQLAHRYSTSLEAAFPHHFCVRYIISAAGALDHTRSKDQNLSLQEKEVGHL